MNLSQLYCFKILARSEHLTKAAEELNYSVPALSAIISRLENEVGVKLFDRVGRNIRLNEYGTLFLKYVEQSLDILDEGLKRISEMQNSTSGIIRIGTFAQLYWLEFFNSFLSSHPNIFISRTKVSLSALANEANIDQYDFVISPESDFHHTNWEGAVLIQNETPLLVLSSQVHLPPGPLSLSDLTNERIIVLSKQDSLRKYFDELCKYNHLHFKNKVECDILFRDELMYSRESYIAFSTNLALAMGHLPNLRAIPITDHLPQRKILIYWKKKRYLSQNMLSLLNAIQEYSRKFEMTQLAASNNTL